VHEYSIVQALLDRSVAEARARGAVAVARICVAIGDVAGVEAELLRSAYELVREGSICARAELEVRPVPALWRCRDCGAEVASGAALRCSACGGPVRLAAGDEIVLERLELEVA